MADKRYDVAIVSIKTGLIESVIGTDMTEDRAERRVMTGLSRIDRDNYFVGTCEPGAKEGDRFKPSS